MPNEQSLRRAVVKNASANLVRLAGSGIVALLLPPVLVRMLPTDTYSAWALLLQLTLYVGLLDFGIQTAVARFVAHADELHDAEQRDGSVSTAAVLLALAATLGFFLVAVLAWQLPRIFTAMPAHLFRGARIASITPSRAAATRGSGSAAAGTELASARFQLTAPEAVRRFRRLPCPARVAELVDALVSGTSG